MWSLNLTLGIVFLLPLSVPPLAAADEDDDPPAGYLGVYLDDAEGGGAIVSAVIVGSPAKKVGLLEGDVIVEIENQPTKNVQDTIQKIASNSPGITVSLRVRRGETTKQLTAVLAERPEITDLLISDDPPRVYGGTVEADGGTLIGSLEGAGNTICNSRGFIIHGPSTLLEVLLDDHPDVNGLQVDGDIVLDGILHVVQKGATAKPGDQFELITGGKSLKGQFKRLILPKPPEGVRWEIVYDNLAEEKDLNSDGDHDVTLTAVRGDR